MMKLSSKVAPFAVAVMVVAGTACADDGNGSQPSASASTAPTAPPSSVVVEDTLPTITTTTESAGTTNESATTTAESTVTTATEGGETVGDPAALAELIAEITDQVRIVYADESLDVPVPDLTTVDPIEALQEINGFSAFVAATAPYRDWARVTTYPGSPSEEVFLENANELMFGELIRVRPEGPLLYREERIVDLATLELPEETVAGMPPDAVGIAYVTDSGPLQLVGRTTGELVREISPGWSDLAIVAILVPTSTGWREWDTILDLGA